MASSASSAMNLKWCKKNLEHYSQAVYDLLQEEYPDLEMAVEDCLDVCGLCTDVPFAMRNNAIVAARDARGLYTKLKKGTSFLTEEVLPGTYTAAVQAAEKEAAQQEKEPETANKE